MCSGGVRRGFTKSIRFIRVLLEAMDPSCSLFLFSMCIVRKACEREELELR